MNNVINLLPDSLANQIAAGEVVQRPASVVKELMENALDAGADRILLILKDSGKSLIQVVDNGCGMSDVDARMCFERHATSKISTSDDLFKILSFGFRGEALASIAAVAHVDLKTKQTGNNLGTHILIEGSKVRKQDPIQTPEGTSFTVKNLFYNVPARRKFLKSDPVELKHIMDEFGRIAIPNPHVFFSVHHNQNELYHLTHSNLRQRIASYFGKITNEKIVPVNEETDFVKITGFTGKPELFRKTRGDQYIFVNRRFIKSPYLGHAVKMAYESLIPADHYPFYVLLLDVDPGIIDVNIHPTKQEVKFENERLIYNLLRVAVRHALGKYSIAPTIDFDAADSQSLGRVNKMPDRSSQPNVNPTSYREKEAWTSFYKDLHNPEHGGEANVQSIILKTNWTEEDVNKDIERNHGEYCFQIHYSYIICPIKSGVMVIDQESAHERILYEKYLAMLDGQKIAPQKSLFPESLSLRPHQAEILDSLIGELENIGFVIEKFGPSTYIINAVPSDGLSGEASQFVENFIDSFAKNQHAEEGISENIARALAETNSICRGKELLKEEMKEMIDMLFACRMPYNAPSGKKCFITFGLDELQNRFKSKTTA